MQGLTDDGKGLGDKTAGSPSRPSRAGRATRRTRSEAVTPGRSRSRLPDEAVDFVKYLLSDKVQNGFAENDMGLPTNPAANGAVRDPALAPAQGARRCAVRPAVLRHRLRRLGRWRDERRDRAAFAARRPRRTSWTRRSRQRTQRSDGTDGAAERDDGRRHLHRARRSRGGYPATTAGWPPARRVGLAAAAGDRLLRDAGPGADGGLRRVAGGVGGPDVVLPLEGLRPDGRLHRDRQLPLRPDGRRVHRRGDAQLHHRVRLDPVQLPLGLAVALLLDRGSAGAGCCAPSSSCRMSWPRSSRAWSGTSCSSRSPASSTDSSGGSVSRHPTRASSGLRTSRSRRFSWCSPGSTSGWRSCSSSPACRGAHRPLRGRAARRRQC